ARLYIAVSSLWTIWPDTHDHHILSSRGQLRTPPHRLAIPILVADDVIRWKQSDHPPRIPPKQQKCRQTDRRSRIPPHRLRQNLRLVDLRQWPNDRWPQVPVRDDPKLPRRRQRQQPLHRLLDHRLLAVERKQLLRAPLPAQRPETRASSPRQNHR